MSTLVALVRPRRPSWPTSFVMVGAALVLLSFVVSAAGLAPLVITTLGAVAGGTGFALGVSASISAFLEREAYADSDFYR